MVRKRSPQGSSSSSPLGEGLMSAPSTSADTTTSHYRPTLWSPHIGSLQPGLGLVAGPWSHCSLSSWPCLAPILLTHPFPAMLIIILWSNQTQCNFGYFAGTVGHDCTSKISCCWGGHHPLSPNPLASFTSRRQIFLPLWMLTSRIWCLCIFMLFRFWFWLLAVCKGGVFLLYYNPF